MFLPGSTVQHRLLEKQQNLFLSASFVVLGGWYYYHYLDEHNVIFENGEYQYSTEISEITVSLSFIPWEVVSVSQL